jgi:hypothetical protein
MRLFTTPSTLEKGSNVYSPILTNEKGTSPKVDEVPMTNKQFLAKTSGKG